MASGSLGQLTIDLAANISRFERNLNRAEQLAEKRSRAIKRTFTRLAAGIGASLASYGFARAAKEALDFADNIGKTADKLGIATESLQEFRFAAEQTGVAQSALDVGIQRFTRRVGEAAQGSGVLKNVLDDLNIELRNADGTMRSTEDILGDYADAIKNAESEQQQLLLAFKAFDTEGAALVNTLKNGKAGLDGYRSEARSLGVVLSDDIVRNSEKANDALNRINQVLRTGTVEAFASLAPEIEAAAEAMTAIVTGNPSKMPEFLKDVAFFATTVALEFKDLGDWAGAVAAILDRLFNLDFSGVNNIIKAREATRAEMEKTLEDYRAFLDEQDKITTGGIIGSAAAQTGGTAGEEQPGSGLFPARDVIDDELAYIQDVLDQAAGAHERYIKQKITQEQEFVTAQKSLQSSVLGNTVALLSTLGRKSKGFAIAALAVQKGLAIAETIMATNVAVMRAFEFYGPTPAGYAAAANMKALGAINVGLIAATGLAQAAQINSNSGGGGGSNLGTFANPSTTTDVTQPFSNTTPQVGGTITINVNGVVTDEIIQDLLIPAIQDSVDNKDVILFRNDSRQALELTT